MAPNRPDIKRKPFAWKVYVLCTVYEKVYVLGTSNGGTRPRYRPCCFAPGYIRSGKGLASYIVKMVRNSEITQKMRKYISLFKSQAQEMDTRLIVRFTW